MSYTYTATEYPVAGVSKTLATNGGAHIFNVVPDSILWNGAFIKKGDMTSFDSYAEAAASTISAKVVWQAANGNWYVEILEDTDVLFVYNAPVLPEERKSLNREKLFCINAANGEVARAHQLKAGDIVELSTSGFSGTPAVGKTISTITGKKPVIA